MELNKRLSDHDPLSPDVAIPTSELMGEVEAHCVASNHPQSG